MTYFYRCARCGAALDAGERCGCEEDGDRMTPHPSPAGTPVPTRESDGRFVPMSQGSRDKVALLRARLGKRNCDRGKIRTAEQNNPSTASGPPPFRQGRREEETVRSDAGESLPIGFYDFFRV